MSGFRDCAIKPALSQSYLIIPAGFDSLEMIQKLTAPEEKFFQFFPENCSNLDMNPLPFTARDDDEFMKLLKNDLDKIQTQNDILHTPLKRSLEPMEMVRMPNYPAIRTDCTDRLILHVQNVYQSPPSCKGTNTSAGTTPSMKSQIAVKSFFESLLSPSRSKDNLVDHRTRQRHAEDALCDFNSLNT